MPKVSIIIPVYNAELYLRRCLDSVCNQTLKDIEIIVVDDASTDDSWEIIQEYSKKYSNLKAVCNEKNGGESVARNKGLDLATGEYLGFVDNDDEVDLDFYEKLWEKKIETNADIVKGNAKETDYYGKTKTVQLNSIIAKHGNDKFYFNLYWWTAIYRRSLVLDNNIRFPEGICLGGDLLFLQQTIFVTKSFSMIDDAFYNYYRRMDSGDSATLSDEKINFLIYVFQQLTTNANDHFGQYSVIAYKYYHFAIQSLFDFTCKTQDIYNVKSLIRAANNIYLRCNSENGFKEWANKNAPDLIMWLEGYAEESLLERLTKYKTPQKRYAFYLRQMLLTKVKKI